MTVKNWGVTLFFLRVLFLFCSFLLLCPVLAVASGSIEVTTEGITAEVSEFSLRQALGVLARKLPLEMRGNVDQEEKITLQFSKLTLRQALKRMMTGYNYVLIQAADEERWTLLVLGKASRSPKQVSVEGPRPVNPSYPAASAQPPSSTDDKGEAGIVSRPDGSSSGPPSSLTPTVTPLPAPSSSSTVGIKPGTDGQSEAGSGQSEAGSGQTSDSDQPFNPAAWGGRGYRGPGRK
jgi:hypothetical protein